MTRLALTAWFSCLILIASALLAACGDDPVLHLAGQDVKESAVRKYVREEFKQNHAVYSVVCQTVRAIAEGINALVSALRGLDASKQEGSLGTRVQGQKGDDASIRRLGQILLEECEAAFG